MSTEKPYTTADEIPELLRRNMQIGFWGVTSIFEDMPSIRLFGYLWPTQLQPASICQGVSGASVTGQISYVPVHYFTAKKDPLLRINYEKVMLDGTPDGQKKLTSLLSYMYLPIMAFIYTAFSFDNPFGEIVTSFPLDRSDEKFQTVFTDPITRLRQLLEDANSKFDITNTESAVNVLTRAGISQEHIGVYGSAHHLLISDQTERRLDGDILPFIGINSANGGGHSAPQLKDHDLVVYQNGQEYVRYIRQLTHDSNEELFNTTSGRAELVKEAKEDPLKLVRHLLTRVPFDNQHIDLKLLEKNAKPGEVGEKLRGYAKRSECVIEGTITEQDEDAHMMFPSHYFIRTRNGEIIRIQGTAYPDSSCARTGDHVRIHGELFEDHRIGLDEPSTVLITKRGVHSFRNLTAERLLHDLQQ